MFENERAIYAFLLDYTKSLMADVPDSELDTQPIPGANTPRWILAHLAICTDYAAKTLGGERACPKEWHAAYGPGSNPAAEGLPKPSKEELLAALERGHERVSELTMKADPTAMRETHAIVFLKETPLQTVENFIGHLMTSHCGGHVGQLSYWRRSTGRAPLF